MYQEIAWIITLTLVALLGITFFAVARNATEATDYAPIRTRSSSLRSRLFLILLAIIVPVIGYTLTKMPYPKTSMEISKTVNVTGHQWYWVIDDLTAKVGKPVLYRVNSADVNHGFAIYDPDLNILTQTQAMPGYTNELLVNYPAAGTYKVLCLEFCGLGHHVMAAEITVSNQ